MQCEELKDLVPLLLVDLLGQDEESVVRRHLDAGCPSCAAELAAARHTLDLLPLALPPDMPSASVKSRLMASVRREKGPRQPSSQAPQPASAAAAAPRTAGLHWSWAAAAGAAGLLLGGIAIGSMMGARSAAETAALRAEIDQARNMMARQAGEMEAMRLAMSEAAAAVHLVSSPSVTVFDLAAQGAETKGAARVFWDRAGSFWQMYGAELPPLDPGRTYQLWFITPTAKVSAGSFKPTADGKARMRVQVPAEMGLIVAAAVTEEPEGGSAQPTGAIRLLGQV